MLSFLPSHGLTPAIVAEPQSVPFPVTYLALSVLPRWNPVLLPASLSEAVVLPLFPVTYCSSGLMVCTSLCKYFPLNPRRCILLATLHRRMTVCADSFPGLWSATTIQWELCSRDWIEPFLRLCTHPPSRMSPPSSFLHQ